MTWPTVELADIADVLRGVTYQRQQARESPEDGYLPLLRATNIGTALDVEDGLVYVPKSVVRDSQRLQVDDIVLASSSGSVSVVGKSARLTHEWRGTFGAFCAVLRTNSRVLPAYLGHYIQSHEVRKRWSDAARGTNINNLKRGDLTGTPVPLPPLDEQHRIVDLLEDHLSRLDAADREVAGAIGKLNSMWQSALNSMRRSFCGEARAPVSEIAMTSLGKMLDAKKQTGNAVPYLRNINVRWGAFDITDLRTTLLEPDEIPKFDIRDGDVIVCEGGEPGRCAVWRGDGSGIAFQKALHRIRVRDGVNLLPDFLALMLEECIRSGRADRLFTGTTIKHLPQEKLRAIEIELPSLELQRAALRHLADVAAAGNRLRASLTATTRHSQALRQSLLAAAFSGRLTGDAADLSEEADADV